VPALYADFIREAGGPPAGETDLEAEIAKGPPAELGGSTGLLLLVRVDEEPAAIGGVRHLDTPAAEMKSMYVAPAQRGRGLGRLLLEDLQAIAAGRGCRAIRLDISDYLSEAIGLYRACGCREVADCNGSPKADIWLELRLDRRQVLSTPKDGAPRTRSS
jgi:ribosomal protein S18 acetylase RimI-like enzyme